MSNIYTHIEFYIEVSTTSRYYDDYEDDEPTYKVILGVLSSLKVLGTFQGKQLVRKFGFGTPIRLLQMVELIGFNPSIYLEPFSPKMDVWKYYKKQWKEQV